MRRAILPTRKRTSCYRPPFSFLSLHSIATTHARTYTKHAADSLPILRISNASIHAFGDPDSAPPLIRDISWTILPHEAWAVVTPNTGVGTESKATLFGALTGHYRLSPFQGALFPSLHERGKDTTQEVRVVGLTHSLVRGSVGRDWTARYGAVRGEERRTLREMYFPELARPLVPLAMPSLALPSHDHINAATSESEEERRKREELFNELSETLQLGEILDRPVIALSNGQTRKARIVKALLHQPEVLLLDEPLTGLDNQTRAILLSLLHTLHKHRRTHVILGMRAHDPLPTWITHIALLTPDGTLRTGTREQVLPLLTVPPVLASSPSSHNTTSQSPERTEGGAAPLVSLADLTLHPPSAPAPLLSSLSWQIHPASRWHLTGANGSGKSTLLALLTGHHPLSYTFPRERLELFGKERGEWKGGQLAERVGWVGAEVGGVWRGRRGGRARVEEVVRDGFGAGWGESVTPKKETWREGRVRDVVRALGPSAWRAAQDELAGSSSAWAEIDAARRKDAPLADEEQAFLRALFATLPPGAQSLVLLMRALVARPPLLLLDEPWAGMSVPMLRAARRYLQTGQGLAEDQAVVVVTHWEGEVPWEEGEGRKFMLESGRGRIE